MTPDARDRGAAEGVCVLLSLTPYLRLQAVELITAALATARAEERAGWEEVAAIGRRMAALIAQWDAAEDASDGGEEDHEHAGMLMLAMTDEAEKFAAALRARGEG